MGEHLTALDATFLELEEADESAHMHIGAIMVFDPLPQGGAPSREALCRHLAERLDGVLPPGYVHKRADWEADARR
jgi:hypothetical protein